MKEKIKVCSECGYPSIMKRGMTGTLEGVSDSIPPKTFHAMMCLNCGRFFGWNPDPPSLDYGLRYIWIMEDGKRTGTYVWTNDPDQEHLVDPSRTATEIEEEIDV